MPTQWTRWLLVAVLAYAVAARLVIALTVPPWQGPDEPKHFEAARVLMDRRADWIAQGRYPGEHDESIPLQREIIASFANYGAWTYLGQKTPDRLPESFYDLWPGMSTQLARPSLYFVVAAVAMLPVEGEPLETQLLGLRLLSVVMSTGAVALTYVAARGAVRCRPGVALAAAGFVAALPMHVFLGGTVNSDNLITLLGSGIAAAVAWGLRRPSWSTWFVAVVAMGLALLSKRTALGLLPPFLLAATLSGAQLLRARRTLAPGALAGITLVILVTALAAMRLLAAVPEGLGGYLFNEPEHPWTLTTLGYRSEVIQSLARGHVGWLIWSFWGIFGWWSIQLDESIYRVLAIVTGLGVVGFGLTLARRLFHWLRHSDPEDAADLRVDVFVAVCAASMVALSIAERLVYQSAAQVPQGRYLFIAVVPLALVHAIGLRSLIPRRVGDCLFVGTWLAGLVVLDAVAYLGYIAPFYALHLSS